LRIGGTMNRSDTVIEALLAGAALSYKHNIALAIIIPGVWLLILPLLYGSKNRRGLSRASISSD
jgi:hypothetical protein